MTTPRPDHQIIACTQCKAADGLSRPGQTLAHTPWAELDGQLGYEVPGVGCMAGCERPCTVAFEL